jgi:RNA polymerase sigma factor (sigma-70 family)
MIGQTLRNSDAKELKNYHDRLVDGLKALGIDHHDAEDSAAVAFCKFLGKKGLSNENGWFWRVARNDAVTIGRSKKRAKRHRRAVGYHAALLREQTVVDPLANLEMRDKAGILAKIMAEALAQLSDTNRHILTQRIVDGLTSKELAEQLGFTLIAVKGRLQRAKQWLRQYLLPLLEECT